MSIRPDLTATWVYRLDASGAPEILLIRRSPGQLYPGIWQCVTGKLEPGESITDGALREVAEEAGLGAGDLATFYETDQVNFFHVGRLDVLLCEAVFAARIDAGMAISLSSEHDAFQWLPPDAACALVPWPAYERAIRFVEWLVANPSRAAMFELPLPA